MTASLVCAGVLGPISQRNYEAYMTTTTGIQTYSNKPIVQMCEQDFGCHRNICWRTCYNKVKKDTSVSWCYTAPDKNVHKYQHDCSGCCECLGPCNS